jgi:hypothetical protein
MVKGGLSDAVIVQMIQNQPGNYTVTPDAMMSLKKGRRFRPGAGCHGSEGNGRSGRRADANGGDRFDQLRRFRYRRLPQGEGPMDCRTDGDGELEDRRRAHAAMDVLSVADFGDGRGQNVEGLFATTGV